jgi:hypothetical protein
MYTELGGYVGYQKTPVREIQECRLSIISEWDYQAEQEAEMKQKQEEAERDAKRANSRR